MRVRKHNGKYQEFDKNKIEKSIFEAAEACGEDIDGAARRIANDIEKELLADENIKNISAEKLSEMVENKLMNSQYKATARCYIRYRYDQDKERIYNSQLIKDFRKKLDGVNIENQNANLDERSFSGRMNEASRIMLKDDALYNRMSKMARENHLNNEIYIHDLDSYSSGMHNCLSIPFDDLLEKGFSTRQADVRSPRSVNTALQLVAVIMQLQSLQQFGGVSATHIDWTLVPYVRYSFAKHYKDGMKYIESIDWKKPSDEKIKNTSINDEFYTKNKKVYDYAYEMTNREVHQGCEALYHNLNTLQSRSGQQLPFSSINYGTCTLPEGRMITDNLLDASIEGIGPLHKTPIFPCGIFQYWKGVNDKPGTPNYDLYRKALKSTSLRLYPNYCNVDWSNNAGFDVNDPKTYMSTMGCRTVNGTDINAEEGTNPQTKDGRGNICPVTIILPTLAMEADRDVEKFMSLLDKKIHEAKDMLLERFEYICSQSPASAVFMYGNGTMLGYKPEEGIRSALKHGTLVIGQLGMAETLQLLVGCDQTEELGMQLAKRIEQLFKDRCAQFKQEEHLNFGVYYTPAENLVYTAMKKFQDKYGVIEKVSDKEYFTNSIHVPVWHDITPFEKIDIESQLTGYSNAGCITYVELDSTASHNIDALEKLVNYAMDKDIPYLALNLPNDTCLKCGFTGEFDDKCPVCGSEDIQHLRRVTGYLTGNYKTAFNLGKQQEVEMRVKHIGKVD